MCKCVLVGDGDYVGSCWRRYTDRMGGVGVFEEEEEKKMTARSYRDIDPIEYDGTRWVYSDTKEPISNSGCKCQSCGNLFKLDLIVPDNLWEKIKPAGKPRGAGLLCGSCIIKKIEGVLGYSVFQLKGDWE